MSLFMAHNDIEIELKFPLKNPLKVKKFLDSNAEHKGEVTQKDTYYTPKHRDFLGVQYPYEWLRLRETEDGCKLAYKHFYPENAKKTDYCDEFQTKIHDVDAMRKIFEGIDIRNVAVVHKKRIRWLFEDVEVSIDEVKELGFFIELEATKEYEDPKEGKRHLYGVLKKINADVGEEDLRGYPFRLLEKKGYTFG